MLAQQNQPQQTLENNANIDYLNACEELFSSDLDPSAKRKNSLTGFTSITHQQVDDSLLVLEKEISKKGVESKLKYKKLKQKLNVLSEQIQEQGLLKDQKDVTSPNKSRLMKLAIQLEKSLKTQAIDYQLVESFLREIQKIVEHRREHDILILRSARLINTLLVIIKRFPSLHKSEALQSVLALDLSLRLLKIMLSLSTCRESFLVYNYMVPTVSLLSCALMRDEKKIATNCLSIMSLVVSGTSRIELQPLVSANIEYILSCSLFKRLRTNIEVCLSEDDVSHSEFMLLAFKFYYLIISISCEKQFDRPIYDSQKTADNLLQSVSCHFQSGIQFLIQSIVDIIYEQEEGQAKYTHIQQELPNFKINILLYIFKTLNIIFYADVVLTQLSIELNSLFTRTLLFLFDYVKQNFKETTQVKNVCSELIIFIGNLTFQNHQNQQIIRKSKLLQSLCNHPLEYIMQPSLRNILVPTFCCIIHNNKENFKQTFLENSVQPILQYVEKEISSRRQKQEDLCNEGIFGNSKHTNQIMSRKTSVSSINSKASVTESYSTQTSNALLTADQIRLQHRFRPQYWEQLAHELKQIDD